MSFFTSMSGMLSSSSSSSILETGMNSAGSIVGGLSAYQQAQKNANYMSAMGRNAMKEAENEAWMRRENARKQASGQRAKFGASGIDVNVGSALNVVADIDARGEMEAADAMYQGQMRKLDWDIRKKNAKQQGRNAMFGAMTSLADPLDWSKMSSFKKGFNQAGGGGTVGGM